MRLPTRITFKNRDFTLEKYEKLCEVISNSKYVVTTFADYFARSKKKQDNEHFIILRHDVDANCLNALDLALGERKYGLKATYYFRLTPKTYIPSILDKIAECNHEVGYHYETVDRCRGDMDTAVNLFQEELAIFRKRYDVKTACMHGNSYTKYDNKEIWKKVDISFFKLIAEPYLSMDYTKFAYFSDSGRTWENNTWRKIKDRVPGIYSLEPKNTDELIEIIKSQKLDNICISAHPERWPNNIQDYTFRYAMDLATLAAKRVIYSVRNN
jgi:hypothetical protein